MSDTITITARKNRWTRVVVWVGMMPITVKMTTPSKKRVSWRCLGVTPGGGRFRKGKKTWVVLAGTLQVNPKEDTTITFTWKPEKVKKPALGF